VILRVENIRIVMKPTVRFLLPVFIVTYFYTTAFGDGMFFYREEVPPDIPYQRAFLIFHEGVETLILQSKYELSQSASASSLGWIVPVPSVPDVSSMDVNMADTLFFHASISTPPRTFAIFFDLFRVVFFIISACSLLSIIILLLRYPTSKKNEMTKKKWSLYFKFSLFILIISFLLSGFSEPKYFGKSPEAEDIEIIKAERAGIYDVKVVKSKSADAILEWLKENSFNFNENDSKFFTDYIKRNWCFVVAKVQVDSGIKENIAYDGMVDPLVLKFNSERAIYPVALTAAIGTKTEILLYTLSDNKLTCNGRLKMRAARKTDKSDSGLGNLWNLQVFSKIFIDLFTNLPQEMFLCKFKDTLTAKQMKEDIVFKKARNNQPYRETRVIWIREE
jgi:hypothetical protein